MPSGRFPIAPSNFSRTVADMKDLEHFEDQTDLLHFIT
jgi:hypothetical protein